MSIVTKRRDFSKSKKEKKTFVVFDILIIFATKLKIKRRLSWQLQQNINN